MARIERASLRAKRLEQRPTARRAGNSLPMAEPGSFLRISGMSDAHFGLMPKARFG
jgi:hypothetical protein